MNRRSFIQRLAGAVAALSMQFSKQEEIALPSAPKAPKAAEVGYSSMRGHRHYKEVFDASVGYVTGFVYYD